MTRMPSVTVMTFMTIMTMMVIATYIYTELMKRKKMCLFRNSTGYSILGDLFFE